MVGQGNQHPKWLYIDSSHEQHFPTKMSTSGLPMCAPCTPYCDVKKTFDCGFYLAVAFHQIG